MEQASRLGEVGACIQIPPNSSRPLPEWGLWPFLGEKTMEPEGTSSVHGKPAVLSNIPNLRRSSGNVSTLYTYVVHRVRFHDAPYRRALELGVNVLINHNAVDY